MDGWAQRNADSLLVVFGPYILVGIPLNLYLYHDVIDRRWRRVRDVFNYCAGYGTLAALSLGILVWYAVVQFFAEDFQEFGAAVLSCILAIYGLYLFSRQVAILHFYYTCLQSRADAIKSGYVRDGQVTPRSKRFFPGWPHKEGGPSYGKLAAVFLDDNYPGEGPRVTWLRQTPEVRDWPEMMVRTGLWIRLAVLPAKLSFYSALRPPLDSGSIGATSKSIGLWTVSSLKLAFFNPEDQSREELRRDTVPLKDFMKCVKGTKGTLVTWKETLGLAPASEWSQALSELPSSWIQGLDTPDVAWEVFLSLALHSDESETISQPGRFSLCISGVMCCCRKCKGGASVGRGLAPMAAARPPSSAEDFKKYVKGHVRETLACCNGHVTAEVLMGAFPEDDPGSLLWLREVEALSQESSRLAELMRRNGSLAEKALCVGVDLIVALALLLGAEVESLKFSPGRTWGGLQDVLSSRRDHVLLQLETEAETLLRASLARLESKRRGGQSPNDVAQAKYSLGKFLVDKKRFDEGTTLCDEAFETWEKSNDRVQVAKGLTNRAELLMQRKPAPEMAIEDFSQAEGLYHQALETTPGECRKFTVLTKMAELYMKKGIHGKAQHCWERALGVCPSGVDGRHLDAVNTRCKLAVALEAQGNFSDAGRQYALAIATSKEAFGVGHPLVATGLRKRAEILKILHKVEEAEDLHKRAFEIDSMAFGQRHLIVGRDFYNLAEILREKRKYAQAEPLYQQAISIGEQAMGPRDPELATWIQSRGVLLKNQGKYLDAMALFQRSLTIRKQVFGHDHLDIAQSLSIQGELEEAQATFEKARPLYEEAQAIRIKVLGPDHPDSLSHRADMLEKEDLFIGAEKLYERVQFMQEEKLGHQHPEVATVLNSRAGVLVKQRRHIEADEMYARALAIDKAVYGSSHPIVARDLHNQAIGLTSQGRYTDADVLYERSMSIYKSALGPDHPHVARTLEGWAVSLLAQERDDEGALKRREYVQIMDGLIFADLLCFWLGRDDEGALKRREYVQIMDGLSGPDHVHAFNQTGWVEESVLANAADMVIRGVKRWYEVLCLPTGGAWGDDLSAAQVLAHNIRSGLLTETTDATLTPVLDTFKRLVDTMEGPAATLVDVVKLVEPCVGILRYLLGVASVGDIPQDLQRILGTTKREMEAVQRFLHKYNARTNYCHGVVLNSLAHYSVAHHSRTLKRRLDSFMKDTPPLSFTHEVDQLRRILADREAPLMVDLAAIPTQAPVLPPAFIVRAALTESIVQSLIDPNRLAPDAQGLLGMGGGGKTVLASSVVRDERVRSSFKDGIFWVRVGRSGEGYIAVLLERLARELAAAHSPRLHRIPHKFDDADEVGRYLSGILTECHLRCLVVLDDVWNVDVVNAVAATGFHVLVTSRDRSVMARSDDRAWFDIGDVSDMEALELLRMASGTDGRLPGEEALQVAHDCGMFPLALAIAGSSVKGNPREPASWRRLHERLSNQQDKFRHMGQGTLFFSINESVGVLDKVHQRNLLLMGVMAPGVPATPRMLSNLWEVDITDVPVTTTILVGNSLLQEGHECYYLHDVILEYLQLTLKLGGSLAKEASVLQTRYLARLDVLQEYSDRDEGVYFLVSLWNSVKRLSQDLVVAVCYTRSLEGITEPDYWRAAGNVLYLLGDYSSAEVVLKNALALVEQEEAGDPAAVAGALSDFGSVLTRRGKYDEAEPLCLRALEIRERILGPDHPDVATLLNCLAELLRAQGKYAEAEPLYLKALKISEQAFGSDHPAVAHLLNNRANLLRDQGNYTEAESLFRRALQIREGALRQDHPHMAQSLKNLAELLRFHGKYAEANPLLQRALEVSERAFGPDHPRLAQSLTILAKLLSAEGKYDEAEPLFRRALEIIERSLGPDHPRVAQSLNSLAKLVRLQGKYSEAEPLLRRALEISERALRQGHPDVAQSLNSLAEVLRFQRKSAEAEPLFRRALEISEVALGQDHPHVAKYLNSLAKLLRFQGKYNEAEPLVRRALEINERALRQDHPDVAKALNSLAEILRFQGKYGEAVPLLRRALEISKQVLGENHPDVAQSLNTLAKVLRDEGKYNEAELLVRRALEISESTLGLDHPAVAHLLNSRANILRDQGKYDEAEPLSRRALEISERALRQDHPHVAQSLNSLAELLRFQAKYAEANPLLQRSLEISERALGPDHPRVAQSLTILAKLLSAEGKYGEAEPLFQKALEISERALGPDHPDVAQSLNSLAILLREEGKYDEAAPLARRALIVSQRALTQDHPHVAQSLSSLAELLRFQGKYGEAEPVFRRALEISERALGQDHPDVAQSLNSLAELLRDQGKYAEAEPLFRRALKISEQALRAGHPDVAQSLSSLAKLLRSQGKYTEAEPLFRRALDISEQALRPDHPDVAQSLYSLAELWRFQGKYAQAEPLFRRALDISERTLRQDHPDVAQLIKSLAKLLRSQGKNEEAERLFRRALEITEGVLGRDHPRLAQALDSLAKLLITEGKYDEARPMLRRALGISERALGPDHPRVAQSLKSLAILLSAEGKYAEANPLLQRALQISEKALGPDHPRVAQSLNSLAILLGAEGNYDEAEPLIRRALEISERALGPDHPVLADSLNNLAKLLHDQGRYSEAEPLFRRALEISEWTLGPDHPRVAQSLHSLAELLHGQEKHNEAIIVVERAVEIRKQALGETHQNTVSSQELSELILGQV